MIQNRAQHFVNYLFILSVPTSSIMKKVECGDPHRLQSKRNNINMNNVNKLLVLQFRHLDLHTEYIIEFPIHSVLSSL